MATVKTMVSGTRKLVVNITGTFSVSDESNVVVINRSDLTGPDGVNIPGRIRVDEITWAVGVGFDYVLLDWDDAADEVIEYLQGQGYMDYRPYGGKSMSGDPTTDTEGDIQLSTLGGATGDTYSILLHCTLKN
jgi:hypothetical protein